MEPAQLAPALAVLAILTREGLWLVGLFILVNGLDEAAMDLAWATLVAARPRPRAPEGPMLDHAVLVPAWREAEVIGPMLRRFLETQRHASYRIFVGVYPNDPQTAAAVAAVADPRVVMVTTARPGPTTKADCLNHLWRAVIDEERRRGRPFGAIVLHDAEDVVHPAELATAERWLQQLAMVQFPVLPLHDPRSPLVAGHYLDEFAQAHGRDMPVRGRLGAPVPSAGVATALRREIVGRLAGPREQPFDPSSLTEDYEIGHRLYQLGEKAAMVRERVDGELVATREYFPAEVDAAVRQKSRWLTGIALAGWDRLGWGGGLAARWMFLRDRKGLFVALVALVGYALALLVLAQLALRWMIEEETGTSLPPLIGGDPWLQALMLANGVILGWRLAVRMGFVAHVHGLGQALLVPIRAPVANWINALAALRALDRYRQALMVGRRPAWEKTSHRYPTAPAA